jgi:hypothetical protein
MVNAPENLIPWASVFSGTAVVFLGLVHADAWTTFLGIAVSAASTAALVFLKRKQRFAHFAGISVEGVNLDSLNIANLRRRLNKSLAVERAFQVAIIEGTDLHVAWQYDGFCRAESETGIEFSIDSENNVAFEQLQCFAYDLRNDPERAHEIAPLLVGSDGVSKKVRVPFLQPLTQKTTFSVLLQCTLPGCVTSGVQYYTSSLSFEQRSIASATVQLIFVKSRPEWVRVYEFDSRRAPTS